MDEAVKRYRGHEVDEEAIHISGEGHRMQR